jgi:hypothetical protein
MSLLGIEDTLEPGELVVGWVVWKDEEDGMAVLGNEDGQPCLFTSHSAAKRSRKSLDVVSAVTQLQYDELCKEKCAGIEAVQPVEDAPVEDPQEAWVRSILAKVDDWQSRSSRRVVRSDPALPRQMVKPEPAPPDQNAKLDRMLRRQEANQKSTPRLRETVQGFVYLLKADGLTGVYKVGYSTDPVRRLETIQTSCPVPLILEWVIPTLGNDGTELRIHRKFSEQRIHGEWFRLSKLDVQWIQTLRHGFRVRREVDREISA